MFLNFQFAFRFFICELYVTLVITKQRLSSKRARFLKHRGKTAELSLLKMWLECSSPE